MPMMAIFLLQCTPALCCFSVMLHNVWHLGGHGPLGPLNPPLAGASQAGFSRLDTVHERVRDRETDRGQTDRQTDERTPADSKDRAYA